MVPKVPQSPQGQGCAVGRRVGCSRGRCRDARGGKGEKEQGCCRRKEVKGQGCYGREEEKGAGIIREGKGEGAGMRTTT